MSPGCSPARVVADMLSAKFKSTALFHSRVTFVAAANFTDRGKFVSGEKCRVV
jgi:hypothetical protein